MKSLILKFAAWGIGFTIGSIAVVGWELLLHEPHLDSGVFSRSVPVRNKFSPSNDWRRVSGCRVAFYVPPSVLEQKVQGTDSCVREYRNENLLINLDMMMGYLTPEDTSLGNEYSNKQEFHLENTVIDGRKAEIITCFETSAFAEGKGLHYVAVLFVPRMRQDGGNLTICTYSRTPFEQTQALKVFESMQFLR